MNTPFVLASKMPALVCVWLPTGTPCTPLICVWVSAKPAGLSSLSAPSLSAPSCSDKLGGLRLCA